MVVLTYDDERPKKGYPPDPWSEPLLVLTPSSLEQEWPLIWVHHIQPLEPILIPKLRIYFADFPYPPSSTDSRLLTLET